MEVRQSNNCIECGKELPDRAKLHFCKSCQKRRNKEAFLVTHGIEKICKHCGKVFKVHPERVEKALFCSYECYWADKGKNKVEITCVVCGKKKKVSPSLARIRHCSSKCAAIGRVGVKRSMDVRKKISESTFKRYGYTDEDRTKPCAICGKPVVRDCPAHLKGSVVCGIECKREFFRTNEATIQAQKKGGRVIGELRKKNGLTEAHKKALTAAKAKSGKRRLYKCGWCGAEVKRYVSYMVGKELTFCSNDCQSLWRKKFGPRGEDHPSYGRPTPKGAGRCKWYSHESPIAGSVKVQGKLELRTAKLLDEAGIQWERNKDRFCYVGLDGGKKTYSPDFKLFVNGKVIHVETKGYMDDACKHKLNAVRGLLDLRVVFEGEEELFVKKINTLNKGA